METSMVSVDGWQDTDVNTGNGPSANVVITSNETMNVTSEVMETSVIESGGPTVSKFNESVMEVSLCKSESSFDCSTDETKRAQSVKLLKFVNMKSISLKRKENEKNTSGTEIVDDSSFLSDIKIMFNSSVCSENEFVLDEKMNSSIVMSDKISPPKASPTKTSPTKTLPSKTSESPATGGQVDADSSSGGNDSLVLGEVKIEVNLNDFLDESPYLKTLPPPKTLNNLSRKRTNCENESPVRRNLASNFFQNQLKQLSSTPFNSNKKWRSASYNPATSSPKGMELVSPLKKIDNNIINSSVNNVIESLVNSNINVMNAVQKSDMCPNLIGDFSTTYALPLISGRHKDLKTISPESLAKLMKGEYRHLIDCFTIVDARYPYEYEGGHIDGSKNIYLKDEINKYFFGSIKPSASSPSIQAAIKRVYSCCSSNSMVRKNKTNSITKNQRKLSVINESSFNTDENAVPEEESNNSGIKSDQLDNANSALPNKRHAIIFHCEFSSERGPTMYRHLRNKDRELNENTYPNLYHPEIYLLHGGYKMFFEKFKELCYPETYLPMHSNDHKQDLKKFRTKSKSWHCERKWNPLFRQNS